MIPRGLFRFFLTPKGGDAVVFQAQQGQMMSQLKQFTSNFLDQFASVWVSWPSVMVFLVAEVKNSVDSTSPHPKGTLFDFQRANPRPKVISTMPDKKND